MKLALKFISTVLLGLLFVSLFAHAAANPDVLASARETWMVALKAGDAAKTSSVFTADAISMPQNFPANVGRKSIQDFYIDGFATLVLQSIELHPVDRKINGPNTSANTAPSKVRRKETQCEKRSNTNSRIHNATHKANKPSCRDRSQ